MYEGSTLIRLVIADDHELIREGIKKIVRHSTDLKIVGEAADLKQARRGRPRHQPARL
jgi:DNA-binding NarL/FixJ family response regulator